MPEYTGRMTNIATKAMLADNERLQSDTEVKFRMVFMYMIQLKVGQTVSRRCFSPVFTVPFYAVNRDEPRRLTGINRDATVEIIQGRTGVYWRAVTFVLIKRCLSYVLTVPDYFRLTRMTPPVEPE